MTVAERAAIPVMAKGREDVIAAGALLLDELVRTFGFPRVIASETDILDGVLLGLADRLLQRLDAEERRQGREPWR
jgi:exopolyphosphatase / guanosine-5'-triphosphate,3'-diphosphate pyrophosphatase